jgi:hypothetical protein
MKRKPITCSKIVPIVVFILGFSLVSCGKNEDTISDKKREKNSAQFLKTFSKPNQEAIALLSQKYELNAKTVEGFLDKYLSDTDMAYRLIKSATESSTKNPSDTFFKEMIGVESDKYLTTLEKDAQAFGINIKIASQIIIDYKTLTSKNDKGE